MSLYEVFEKLGLNTPSFFPLKKMFQQHHGLYTYLWKEPLRIPNHFRRKSRYNFLYEDWDYCIVLDACRFDIFKKCFPSSYGTAQSVVSPASNTVEWIKRCLYENHPDMVLATANPKQSKYKLRQYTGEWDYFYHNEPVWDYGWNGLNDGGLPTVMPWTMVDAARRKLLPKYEDKRILFWFLQPHYPFISSDNQFSTGLKLRHADDMVKAWDAYQKNMETTVPYVAELIDMLDGKILVTADHGEAFGEMFIFEHPTTMYIPPLVEVPFLEVKK